MVKASPKRRREKEDYPDNMTKYKSYGFMALYFLVMIAGLSSAILFVVYATEAHGPYKEGLEILDEYEHDFGRMVIAACATMICLLFLIFSLVSWIAYNVHHHYHQ